MFDIIKNKSLFSLIYSPIICKEHSRIMKKEKIIKLRKKINDLDDKLLFFLDERSRLVNEIGKLKDKTKGVIDPDRERTIINRLLNKIEGHYSKDSIVRIWRELFYSSSQIQIGSDSNIRSKRGIDNIQIYKGGKANIHGQDNTIKLSSNENALKASPKVLEVIKNDHFLHRYGEISGQTLREQLSKIHSINKDQIILGNGSNEILLMSAIAFCHPGDEIIHSRYGFEMYSIITKIVGAVSVIANQDKYKINIESILNNITSSTKLILIDNPNNPTGTFLSKTDLNNLLSKISKNVIVVIDGAYAEYVKNLSYDSSFDLVKKYNNLIITRTFSKVYGLAGMRLGWCYTSKKIAFILNKVKPPFNVNKIALSMASVALKDTKHLRKNINENERNRSWFQKELKKINIKCLPSSANFTFIECKQNSKMADQIFNILLNNGIIVRQLHSYGLPYCLRITIGTRNEMKKTIEILKTRNI